MLKSGCGLCLEGFKPLSFSLDGLFSGGEGKAGTGLGGEEVASRERGGFVLN